MGTTATESYAGLIKQARYQKGYSQRDLADLLGTTQLEIIRWENGRCRPNNYYQVRLADVLDIVPTEGLVLRHALQIPARLIAAGILPTPPLETAIPLPFTRIEDMVGQQQKELLALLSSKLKKSRGQERFALSGLPGIGKTMMACAVANVPEIQKHFSGGVLWVELGPAPALEEQLCRAATLVGVDPHELSTLHGTVTVAKAVCRAIHTKSMLIIIDDVWNIEDALAMKIGGPHCTYLLTTRFPQIARTFSSDPTNAITVQELEPESGLALLERLAPSVVRSERSQVKALIQAAGGLPLALTLIGNYLHIQASFGQQRRLLQALIEMGDPQKRLQLTQPQGSLEKRPGLAGMSYSLESIIKISDERLGEKARWALRALSTFPPKPCRFSEKAALEVAACSVETLDCLVDAGLIECCGNDYTMHPVIADFAQQSMVENRGVVIERMVRYALACLDEATASSSEDEQSIMIAAFAAASEFALWDKLAPQLSAHQKKMLRKLLPSPRGHTTVVPLHGTRFLQSLETGGDVGLTKLGVG